MLSCVRQCLLLILINTHKAEQPLTLPFDPNNGNHINYLQHKFYDIYFFERNQTILDNIKLINNPNATIQQNVSNTDDVPEIRFDLEWDFKFYGHLHNWITVSPNGFLTTHPVTCYTFCNWWYESGDYRRYIAPIMADFNPSKYNESHVLYYIDNNEKSINVQWHNVTLWQPTNTSFLGYKYDFQVKLKSDGTIIFYYFNVPKSPSEIGIPLYSFENYSVMIGLEDAAYKHSNDGLYYLYPYDPINVNQTHILSHQTIVFKPRQTCIDQMNCNQCQILATDPGSDLACGWCPTLGLCSDGMGREIYEYSSSDYCTYDEMIHDLFLQTCIDYVIDSRICKQNDHVLARHPTEMVQQGISRLYSGVIISLNSDSNTYLIIYDNESISDSIVQYSWVHPCSTVSYDYSSYDLPPHCMPHCNSMLNIDTIDNNNTQIFPIITHTVPQHEDKNEKRNQVIRSIGIAIAVLVVICAIVQFFLYRGRRIRRQMIDNENIIVNDNESTQRGIQIDDDEYDLDNDNTIIGYHLNRTMSLEDDNANRMSCPIISPAKTYEITNKFTHNIASSVDDSIVDVEIHDEIGLGEVADNIVNEDTSSSSDDGDDYNINKQTKDKQWDMTPLTR